MPKTDFELVKEIAGDVARLGGNTYYVGGYVRDKMLGKPNKDIDIEVHGIEANVLSDILRKYGDTVTIGSSFGIHKVHGYDVDIALPRTETATGRGHKDFEVYVDPYIGEEKAASRRDFSINALMENVLTGEVLDFYNGKQDLKDGIIRHVNDKAFAEDPLRVLRAAQFASRFGFKIADETVSLARTASLTELTKERVFDEFKKAMTKSKHPSEFFIQLNNMYHINSWFPEITELIWSKEGKEKLSDFDRYAVFQHNAKIPVGFMISALDIAPEDAVNFTKRITSDLDVISYVENMTSMKGRLYPEMSPRRMYDIFDESKHPLDLVVLDTARISGTRGEEFFDIFKPFDKALTEYERLSLSPKVTGNDLIKSGKMPGKDFAKALKYAHKLQLDGVSKDTALKMTLGYMDGLTVAPWEPPSNSGGNKRTRETIER